MKAPYMKTYKFKLYSNHGNCKLHRLLNDVAADIWNHCIALHRRYYQIYGKTLGKFHLMRHIAKLRNRGKYAHWKLLNSQSVQNIILRIAFGYDKFFADRKQAKKTRRPRFKARHKYKSFTLTQSGWLLLPNGRIKINKRIYRYFNSREVQGKPKRCTIKRDSVGDFYIFIVTDHTDVQSNLVMTGNAAGFDFGLKRFLTSSDYNDVESPEFFKRGMRTIRRKSQAHSQKQKRSKNRERARLDLARAHRRIVNQREDFHWQLAHQLTDRYDWVSFEDLNIGGMKSLWGRKVSDLSFSDFMNKLKWIALKKGCIIIEIDRWYPSSRTCSVCGHVNENLNLRDRTWQCPSCHTQLDRDRNAAINIHRVGASTLAGEDVRSR